MPRADRTPRAGAWAIVVATTALLGLGGGCSRPTPPPTDAPPEPQAAHGALRDAVAGPVDRARSADATVQAAEARRREAIDAAD